MNNKLIESYGYTAFYQKQIEDLGIDHQDLIPGRVIEVHREQYKIVTEFGESRAKLKGALFYQEGQNNIYPAVGDFVLVKHNPNGEDIIYQVLARKSKFSRMDSFHEVEQVVATNFDYVFIMTSLNHDFNIKRIERYLTIAWQSGAIPIIVLTKADLCGDYTVYEEQLRHVAIGVPIVAVSAKTGEGIKALQSYIKPTETIVFLGSSGVGKSSLVNAIAGEEVMKVNDIREEDSKGRHTTTHRQLVMLQNGTMIIDTPGMRELGMWDVEEGLHTAFDDIQTYASKCRFNDCSHHTEPGCAIKAALASGELTEARWKNYIKLKKEIKFAEAKENANMRMQEKARYKQMSKFQKSYKKDKR